jgi:hypothetical protein
MTAHHFFLWLKIDGVEIMEVLKTMKDVAEVLERRNKHPDNIKKVECWDGGDEDTRIVILYYQYAPYEYEKISFLATKELAKKLKEDFKNGFKKLSKVLEG